MGLTFQTINGGIGRRVPSADAVGGLICNGIASGSVVLGTSYRLNSLQDAIDLGIDQAYDDDNDLLVYEHVKEVFRLQPNATLWIMVVAQSVTFANMVDPTQVNNALKLINDSAGTIRELAVAYNPSTPGTVAALTAAIPKAKLLVDQCFQDQRPICVYLEGKYYDPASSFDFRAMNARGVAITVGQSDSVYNNSAVGAGYAAVGTMLGAVLLAKVNESVAWVEKFNLLGDNLQRVRINGVLVSNVSSGTLSTIETHGFNYMMNYSDFSGIYFNNNATGDVLTSDYAYIAECRVMNKAMRIIRQAVLPSLNAPVAVDTTSGQLSPVFVAALQTKCNTAIQEMFNNQEVSGPDPKSSTPPVTIDPNQDVLATGNIDIALTLVPTGTARSLTVKMQFSNPF